MIACACGHLDAVKVLVELGAKIDAISLKNDTPLSVAACVGHPLVVAFLIESGANVEQCITDGSTPLVLACERGHTDVARVLLDFDANPFAPSVNGQAISVPFQLGHVELMLLMSSRFK